MWVCPKCGYVEPFAWRGPYSKGTEVAYAKIDELRECQPEIVEALMKAPLREKNPIREVVVGPYAYGLWKSGYVRRRYVEIWKHQGWAPILMEKVKK